VHDADVLRLLESQHKTYLGAGTSYRYKANSGYSLLSLIVEKASGQGFATFLKEGSFCRSGMQHTVRLREWHLHGLQSRLRLQRQPTEPGGAGPERPRAPSSVMADLTSIDDMARWDAAL